MVPLILNFSLLFEDPVILGDWIFFVCTVTAFIGMNGLAGAEPLLPRCPEIIFVTAHHQYAVDAFETNAIGYLLKPAELFS